jgi:hypothetical protein
MIEITAWDEESVHENTDGTCHNRFGFHLDMRYDTAEQDIVDAVEQYIYEMLNPEGPPWQTEGHGNGWIKSSELVDVWHPSPSMFTHPRSVDAQRPMVATRMKMLLCNNHGIENWIIVRDLGPEV